jgi:pyruvate kinase
MEHPMVSETIDCPSLSRTKTVATIGPASQSPQMLRSLVAAGVSVFRLNFSHGTHEQHSRTLAEIRRQSRELERHVAVLQDLCGPKMRLGEIAGDVVDCAIGEVFTLVSEPGPAVAPSELTSSYRELPNDLRPGETVLFADGTVAMTVTETRAGRAVLEVTLPGRLRSRQGINLPGSDLAVASLTDKDLADLDWTAGHCDEIDFVGLSFVRSADDVRRLRSELETRGCRARIVAKIEKPQAVIRLKEIIAASDAVMVARGDLGVEMDVDRVPAVQKRVIRLCNAAHRPVITATQMLNSMEHSSRPTRAEATDVFNAVVDGTDAVMLSGETAVGDFPIETVRTMQRICNEAEAWVASENAPRSPEKLGDLVDPLTEAAVDAARVLVERTNARLVVVGTESGRTALALSNRRPSASILALTRSEPRARALALAWGVTAIILEGEAAPEQDLEVGMDWAKSHDLVRSGDHAVFVRGQSAEKPNRRALLAAKVP